MRFVHPFCDRLSVRRSAAATRCRRLSLEPLERRTLLAVPVALPDAYDVRQDDVLVVDAPGVLANDVDGDGDTLTATQVDPPDHGSLTLAADGSFTYVPTKGFSGSDTFSYKAADGSDSSPAVEVSITVESLSNRAPAANADTYSVDKNDTLIVLPPGVLWNDTDADHDPLTAVLTADPSNGALTLEPDGSFTYTPANGFSGSDTFRYKADDGTDSSPAVTVSITVESLPNRAPVADADVYSVRENKTLDIAAPGVLGNDTDADHDPLTVVLLTEPSNGWLALNPDGSFRYLPAAGFDGTDSFTYKASDGQTDSEAATVMINVEPASNSGWVLGVGGSEYEYAWDVAVDAIGNAYVCGSFSGTADFEPGQGKTELTSAGSFDGFVAKYSSLGELVWVRQLAGPQYVSVRGVALHDDEHLYVVGLFMESVAFGETVLASAGDQDVFVAELDSATGTFHRGARFGGTGYDVGEEIAVDAHGNVYVTGCFSGTAQFGQWTLTAAGDSETTRDIFVVKLESSQWEVAWASRAGSPDNDLGRGIAVDASGVCVVGSYRQSTDSIPADFGETELLGQNAFVTKLDLVDGTFLWTQRMGPVGAGDAEADDVAVDSEGNVIVTGMFKGTADFGSDELIRSPERGGDAFVTKLDGQGVFLWARQIGDAAGNLNLFRRGSAVAIDSDNNVYVAGWFQGRVDFDPGPEIANLLSAGPRDGFLLNLGADGDYRSVWHIARPGMERGDGVAIHADRDAYVTGVFDGTSDSSGDALSSAGLLDVFLLKLADAVTLNEPPVAEGDTYTVTEYSPLDVVAPGVLGNDRDQDGDPLSAVLWTQTSDHLVFQFQEDGSFVYVPRAGFYGTDSFTYRADDGRDRSEPVTVTITVRMQEDAYEPNNDRATAADLTDHEEEWLNTIEGPGVQADDDWYRIDVVSDDRRLVVDLAFLHAEGNVDLELIDAAGTVRTTAASATDNEQIDAVLPSEGTWYLRVHGDSAGSTYDLSWDVQYVHSGDANFDRVTDVRDFNIWNANKFTDGTDWSTGDFNVDGETDVRDFNVWNAHKFTSAPVDAPVDAALVDGWLVADGHGSAALAGEAPGGVPGKVLWGTASLHPSHPTSSFATEELLWLQEFQPPGTRDQSCEKANLAEAAIDKLLATYWRNG